MGKPFVVAEVLLLLGLVFAGVALAANGGFCCELAQWTLAGTQHICPPAGESDLPAQDRGLTATDVKPLLLATVRHTTRRSHSIGRGPHSAAAAAHMYTVKGLYTGHM